jgi:hypothetical protein
MTSGTFRYCRAAPSRVRSVTDRELLITVAAIIREAIRDGMAPEKAAAIVRLAVEAARS